MILFAFEIPSDKKFFDKEKNEKKRKPSLMVVEIDQARFLRKSFLKRILVSTDTVYIKKVFFKTRRA